MSDQIVRQAELLKPLAEALRVLGHPYRLMVVGMLKSGECSVGDMAERLGLTIAGISYHLKAMERAGLLSTRRDGRHIMYHIAAPMVEEICSAICSQMEEDLQTSEEKRRLWGEMRAMLGSPGSGSA